MKKIYVLYGRHDFGKTESIKKLIDLLIADGYRVADYEKNSTYDIWATLIAPDETKIGITTRGDSEDDLEADFKNFTACERIVCAARSDGKTHNVIRRQTAEENIFWLSKSAFESTNQKNPSVKYIQNLVNLQTAKMLKSILKTF